MTNLEPNPQLSRKTPGLTQRQKDLLAVLQRVRECQESLLKDINQTKEMLKHSA